MTPWSLDVDEIFTQSRSSPKEGLSGHAAKELLEKYGANTLEAAVSISRREVLIRQIKNPMAYTLVVAAVLAGLMGELVDATAILAIVVINTCIGYFQERKAHAAIDALKKLTVPKAKVIRSGKVLSVDSSCIVPGDLLTLEAGDYVVADARVVESYQLSTDEAVLTGESLPVRKSIQAIAPETELADRVNIIFAGTAISAGAGKAIVMSTGMKTEVGQIASLLNKKQIQETPLQKRLKKLSHVFLQLGIIVIALVSLLGYFQGLDWFSIFMSAISLAVAAIPEGLPTVVTLALTLSLRRMTKRNALVRNISAVETLGSTDLICTDKTGTLTTGKMQVREVYTKNVLMSEDSLLNAEDELVLVMALCNNASLNSGGSGDSTELALLNFLHSQNIELSHLNQIFKRIYEWSFDSDRKLMSVAMERENEYLIASKGAPDAFIYKCHLNPDELIKVEELIKHLSGLGRRLLAFGSKMVNKQDFSQVSSSEIEQGFDFLGLVALADPPKLDSKESILQCKAAGIKVVMITGDHPLTAKAIGDELGILSPGFDQVMTGKELQELDENTLSQRVSATAIYARVTPEHKLKIIEALQSLGHVVAMTGDGVNDAPALKRAAIGVSMGKTGTEVARQASGMILTDDNFSTIVAAVEEGRAIFGNIKRTIQYLLSTNLAEMLIMFTAALMGLPAPLFPLSLLWINLVTDGFPSLALAAEPVERGYLSLSKGPSPKSFFNRSFIQEMLFVAVLMTLIEVSVYQYALKNYDLLTARSYALSLLSYLCLLRSFSCRSERKTYFQLPFNPWHFAATILPVLLLLFFERTSLYQSVLEVRPLSIKENGVMFSLGAFPVSIVEIYKFWRYR